MDFRQYLSPSSLYSSNTATSASTIEPEGDLCYVNDYYSANRIFNRVYSVSDECGLFSKCSRSVRHTNPLTGEHVDVIYCSVSDKAMAGVGVFGVVCALGLLIAWKAKPSTPAYNMY
jgi:hypothetical protein